MATDPLTDLDRLSSPPWVILEHVVANGVEIVRVVGLERDEGKMHDVAATLADAGLRVFVADLRSCNVTRYLGRPHAAWLYDQGGSATAADAPRMVTEAGH